MVRGMDKKIEYSKYYFKRRELLLYLAEGMGIICFLSYIFYRSIWGMVILLPFLYFYLRERRIRLCEKRKRELSLHFKEAMQVVASSLQAGYSVENAFIEIYHDSQLLFSEDSFIVKELKDIAVGIENNIVLEKLLFDLAERSEIEDIQSFCEIFQIAKRSGGDLKSIILLTVHKISEKIEVDREIQTILSAKQYEQTIMNIVPFLIILYIDITSLGYFQPLYHNAVGMIIMSICLAAYCIAYRLAQKIIRIEV